MSRAPTPSRLDSTRAPDSGGTLPHSPITPPRPCSFPDISPRCRRGTSLSLSLLTSRYIFLSSQGAEQQSSPPPATCSLRARRGASVTESESAGVARGLQTGPTEVQKGAPPGHPHLDRAEPAEPVELTRLTRAPRRRVPAAGRRRQPPRTAAGLSLSADSRGLAIRRPGCEPRQCTPTTPAPSPRHVGWWQRSQQGGPARGRGAGPGGREEAPSFVIGVFLVLVQAPQAGRPVRQRPAPPRLGLVRAPASEGNRHKSLRPLDGRGRAGRGAGRAEGPEAMHTLWRL